MPLYKRSGLFNPHETHLTHSLAGAPLAPFSRRFWAFALDTFLLALINIPSKIALQYFIEHKLHLGALHQSTVLHLHVKAQFNMEMTLDLLWTAFLVLYFGLFFRFTNGLTPGKRLLGIRVVSLTHPKLSLWQSIERALGYGASALEAGFGFFQYFLNPNHQCAHDRLAETIVVLNRPNRVQEPKPSPPANDGQIAQ
jgi:uncharacterized RDD family membrane protein YckC